MRLRWPFAAWGADAALSGHEHSYERLAVDGIPYIINGSGGSALRGFGPLLSESRVRDAVHYGAQRIAVDSAGARIEFWSVDGLKIDDIALPHARLLSYSLPHRRRSWPLAWAG